MASKIKQLFQEKGMEAVVLRLKERGIPKDNWPTRSQLEAPGPLSGRPHKRRGRLARMARQERANDRLARSGKS